MKKLILHIPHSSTYLPSFEGYVADEITIQNEILKLTDWYTDDLFNSEKDINIVTPFSRIFCDVERFENDEDEVMAKVGMGVLYERCDNGEVLREVTPSLRETVIQNYYRKHHDKFSTAVENQLQDEGSVLIIDCHSFPSTPLQCAINQTKNTPDFNIGVDPFHTSSELTEIAIEYFRNLGYSWGLDWPYSGTIVPMEYYQKNNKVQSIMLEVNRRLYLDEPTNKKSTNFENIKQIITGFLEVIRRIE
jgi:N-formylglutamate amidohydrolase